MAGRPLVLVVEDDVELNQLERDLLEVHGLASMAAYTGAQALELTVRCHADAILLDIMLPEMDGFEALRRLRAEGHRHLPVVVLSALDSEECRRRSQECGANAYFSKPFDPDEVIHTLQNLITSAVREP